MGYSAVSQIAKRFEQKSEVNDEIKESMQKVRSRKIGTDTYFFCNRIC